MSRHDRDPLVVSAVTRAREGDSESIPFLYLRYRDAVQSYVLTILPEPKPAHDVTLHTFLALRGAVAGYEPRTSPFSAWLLRLARGVAIEHLRGQRLLDAEQVFDRPRRADLADLDLADEAGLRIELALASLDETGEGKVVPLRHR